MASKEKLLAIKELHNEYILLIKEGEFYHVYNRDAYILSYLLEYKVKKVNDTIVCGFPKVSLSKVEARLENKKINYMEINKSNNYEIYHQENFKDLNNYNKFYYKAKEYINKRNRIDNINNYLLSIINDAKFKNIINKMEEIINENGKIYNSKRCTRCNSY